MSEVGRREFLKLSAAGGLAFSLPGGSHVFVNDNAAVEGAALPDIPTTTSMRSITMTHRFGDLFNPPGLTNQWGCAQAAMDVVAIRSIAFPPFAQGEMNVAPLGSGGELLTGVLFVDGEYFAATKTPIEFVWQPDHIKRRAT